MANNPAEIVTADYTYTLPVEQIATHPLAERDASKLLVYKSGNLIDEAFVNLPTHLPAGTLLVLNNTKVIRARLIFQKQSGGQIQVFCLEPAAQAMEEALQQTQRVEWKCLIGGASKWKPGQVLQKEIDLNGKTVLMQAVYKGKSEDSFLVEFCWKPAASFSDVLEAAGQIPLPPYIKRQQEAADTERYQTVFGSKAGSVAAPTAALHFTEKIFAALKEKGVDQTFVTLNVGAGTFKPIKSETVGEHEMHGEFFTVTKEAIKAMLGAETIVTVGTTSLRTVESLYWLGVKLMNGVLGEEWNLGQWEAYQLNGNVAVTDSLAAILEWMKGKGKDAITCRTNLLIAPGYSFKIPTGLITNFHQPGSTLLLLIAAFVGKDWGRVYEHALTNNYRFLSYGDSSLLWRHSN